MSGANLKVLLEAVVTINCLLIYYIIRKKRKIRKRSMWSKTWLQRRLEGKGSLNLLNNELKNEDPNAYKNFLRLDDNQFMMLLGLIESDIKKESTKTFGFMSFKDFSIDSSACFLIFLFL